MKHHFLSKFFFVSALFLAINAKAESREFADVTIETGNLNPFLVCSLKAVNKTVIEKFALHIESLWAVAPGAAKNEVRMRVFLGPRMPTVLNALDVTYFSASETGWEPAGKEVFRTKIAHPFLEVRGTDITPLETIRIDLNHCHEISAS